MYSLTRRFRLAGSFALATPLATVSRSATTATARCPDSWMAWMGFRSLAVFGHLHEKQFRVADDARQDIVEVMGNAAGQKPDTLHFLSPLQLGFHGFSFNLRLLPGCKIIIYRNNFPGRQFINRIFAPAFRSSIRIIIGPDGRRIGQSARPGGKHRADRIQQLRGIPP